MKNNRILAAVLALLIIAASVTGCSGQVDNTDSASSGGKLQAAAEFINVAGDETSIDEENIYGIVNELASEKYAGRLAGTPGNKLSAEYIAEYFAKLGLENPKGLENYMQYYNQPYAALTSEPLLRIIDSAGNIVKDFENADDFVIRFFDTNTRNLDADLPIYILENSSQLTNDKERIKGSALLVSVRARENIGGNIIRELLQTEAAVVLMETDLVSSMRRYSELVVAPFRKYYGMDKHGTYITIDSEAYSLLKAAGEKEQKVSFSCDFSAEASKRVPNVIGLLPGSDPKLKDDYIIIGAHFDHVGDNMNGTYNSGALDNASGTAVMMEIARLMSENKAKPKKSILFMAFNGEECGLLGSQYYAQHPIYPLDRAVMINLDMVGSTEELPLCVVTHDGGTNELKEDMVKFAKQLGITTAESPGGGSDHISFGEVGVPSVILINEDFLNGYHSYKDNMEDVSKPRLEQVVKLVMYYLDKRAY
ncbi:MAG: M28 family metallopeptidase [Bacillota bacterium]